jgi:hypothetical protein
MEKPMPRRILSLLGLLVISLILRPGFARADEEAKPEIVLRSYNISELVQTVPDYPLEAPPVPVVQQLPAPTPGTPAGQAAVQKVEPSSKIDALLELIRTFVASDSWKENGGTLGTMQLLDSTLIISQTEENHHKIQSLLEDIRRDSAVDVLIQVDACWLLLSPEQFASLQNSKGIPAKLMEEPQSLYCRARTLGFNGQTLSVSSGRLSEVVDRAMPVVGQNFGAYDLQSRHERAGVALQVTPRLSRDRKAITIDVRSTVTDGPAVTSPVIAAAVAGQGQLIVKGLKEFPVTIQPTTQSGMIRVNITQPDAASSDSGRPVNEPPADHPSRIEQTFRTTVRVSPDSPLVIGGMTLEPGRGDRQLYLVLTAHPLETAPREAPPKDCKVDGK